jgi:hypothetical protein
MSQANYQPQVRILSTIIIAALFGALLYGCGGGSGSSSTAPAAVTLNWSVQQTKTFHFTWNDVSGETEYRLLENPDGSSGYTPVATITADSTSYDLVVSLPKRINAQYIMQSCNSVGCTDSNVVSFTSTLVDGIGYLKASNTDALDWFGLSLALSADGATLAVGADGEDSSATGINGDEADNSAGASGAVYLFSNASGSWAQTAYLKASNTDAYDYFGDSLALSADGATLAVGAYGEDSSATGIGGNEADNSASASGAVYLFSNSSGSWSQTAYLKASNTDAGDGFGTSVALSADGATLAVGAYGEDSNATGIGGDGADNTAGESGAVYLFSNGSGSWAQSAYLKASNTGAGDAFGYHLALSADGATLAVGAVGEDSNATGINGDEADNTAGFSGAVYLFSNSSGSWAQSAYLKASNTGAGDAFGYHLALSADGTTLAVGAYGEASSATGIGGDETDNTAGASGAVYLFSNGSGSWAQSAYLKASNTDAGDLFGASLALSADGATLAVGAEEEDSNATGINGDETDNTAGESGAVYLFSNSSGSWAQTAYLKASNTDAGDLFGYRLALSADGATLAVGAPLEAGSATGINGDEADNTAGESGAVYLY